MFTKIGLSLVAATLLLLLLPLAKRAHAVKFEMTKVVITGDPAPPDLGGIYDRVGGARINDKTDITFFGRLTGGAPAAHLLRTNGMTHILIVRNDHAPGTSTGTIQVLGSALLNDEGEVAYRADIVGDEVRRGIFKLSSAFHVPILLSGSIAPGTKGGVFRNDFLGRLSKPSLNDHGHVVFSSQVSGGSAEWGIFVDDAVLRGLVFDGDPAPGTMGGTFDQFGPPEINNANEVSFATSVLGTPERLGGIFLSSGDDIVPLVLRNEQAPRINDMFLTIFSFHTLNDAGEVAFGSTIGPKEAERGIFVASESGKRAIALSIDEAPGTGGGNFNFFSVPHINTVGDVAFASSMKGGTVLWGIFLYDASKLEIFPVALSDQKAPVPGEVTFQGFSVGDPLDLNEHGEIVFDAGLSDGSVGVFLAKRDEDEDGITDRHDKCLGTVSGNVIDIEGCSIAQLAPCTGPREGDSWKNHGNFVLMLKKVLKQFEANGLISKLEAMELFKEGATSDCGRRNN